MSGRRIVAVVAALGLVLAGWLFLDAGGGWPAPETVTRPVVAEGEGATVGGAAAGLESTPREEGGTTPLAERAVLGTVTERGGEALAGITLELFEAQRDGWKQVASTTSDADGRFRIPCAPQWQGRLRVDARADGFVGMSTSPVLPDRAVEIQVSRLVMLFGTVQDAATKRPVAGATLRLAERDITSDGAGSYRIPCPVGLQQTMLVSSADHADKAVPVLVRERRDTRLDVLLEAGIPLTIQVFDRETGEGIAGAGLRSRIGGPPSRRADREGRVTLRVVEGRDLSVNVSAPGYCGFKWWWKVAGAEALSPRIPLLRPGTIEGRVVDEAGVPVTGARVIASSTEHPFGDWQLTEAEQVSLQLPGRPAHVVPSNDGRNPFASSTTESGEDGRFHLGVVPQTEPYRLVVRKSGVASWYGTAAVAASGRVFVEVRLQRGATIHGRVLVNGKPWSGRVAWKSEDGNTGGSETKPEDGAYHLDDVPPGRIELALQEWGADRARPGARQQRKVLEVTGGGDYEHDFTWTEEIAAICGRVTLTSGAPAPAASVSGYRVSPGSGGFVWQRAQVAADGGYRLEIPAGSHYRVTATNGTAHRERDDVPAGATGIDFVLPEAGRLRIRLVDAATREPVSGSEPRSQITWREAGSARFQSMHLIPLREGIAELPLPVGLVDLHVQLRGHGYVPRLLRSIPVTAEGNAEPLTIELTRGLELKLRLAAHLSDEQQRDHLVFLLGVDQLGAVRGPYPQQGGPSNIRINGINMWLEEPGLTLQLVHFEGSTGRVVMRGLAPGRYVLRAFPADLGFEPAELVVPSAEEWVEVRWR